MDQEEQDFRLEMLDSLIELLNTARLEKDATMLDSYARLVYEAWAALKEGETND